MVFTRHDIVRSFSKTIAERGQGYFLQGNVLDVWLDENGHFHARVIGSEWEPYQVRLVPTRRSDRVELHSDCTCPYKDQCKHGAAVAYEILEHGYRQDDDDDEEEEAEREFVLPAPAPPVKLDIPVPTDLVDWLRKVESSLSDKHALAEDVKQRLFYRLKLKPNAWGGYGLAVSLVNRTLLKSGGFGVMTEVKQSSVTNWQKPKHWSQFDAALIADLHANLTASDYNATYVLDGRHGDCGPSSSFSCLVSSAPTPSFVAGSGTPSRRTATRRRGSAWRGASARLCSGGASAKKVAASAKLDRLIEMLGVLLQDGRRVLLFSQFTSMLDLIEERVKAEKIEWVRISSDTEDRETPVQRFQAGEVPLFLISLKAGGTGLNLTAADTVILYDPWWNPAVENQAIDRAHRIGQENPVIVYKLVAAGTIEEKMLEMQARKGDIARSILDDDAESIRTLTADDLRWILS